MAFCLLLSRSSTVLNSPEREREGRRNMSNHQNQEFLLQQQTLAIEQGLIPEGLIYNQLSLLHIDQEAMEAANGSDQIPAPGAEQSRSDYGSITPLKRRSPCSAFAPPLQSSASDAGYRPLTERRAGKESTASACPLNSAPVCRCSSLPPANGGLPKSPAEIQGRGVADLAENRTRRPLFQSPANQSLPPLRPLNRTVSDPSPFSYLQNQEGSSSKRVKWIDIHTLRQHVNQLMDQLEIQEGSVDSTNGSEIAPMGDRKVVNGGSEVAVAPELGKEVKEEDAGEREAGMISLETIGDCTQVEFTCKCGSGYSLRVIGPDFFYRLSG